jgi:hypothetical protein
MERPSTPPAQTGAMKELTRDQRVEARTLKSIDWKYTDIVEFFKNKGQKVTYRQIYYACTTQATPRKRSGRAPVITAAQIDQLVEYISQSKTTRRLPLWRLAIDLSFEGIGVTVARSALPRVGYKR